MLAIGTTRGEVLVVDSQGRTRFKREERHGKVFCVSLSPDGRSLASGSQDGTLNLWDVGTGKIVRNLKANSMQQAGCAREGAAGGHEGVHAPPCRAIAWCPSGKLLASGDESGQVCLWNLADPAQDAPLQRLCGDRGGVLSVAFSPDGSGRVASGGGRGSITVWDRDGAVEWTRADVASQVRTVVFSPDGQKLASAGSDAAVQIWDAASGALLHSITFPSSGDSVSWSSAGELACGGDDMAVRIFDAQTGRLKRCIQGHDGCNGCLCQPFSQAVETQDGFSGHHDWAWAVATPGGKTDPNCQREGHRDWVRAVSFAPDGKQLASGSWDGAVKIWDREGRLVRSLDVSSLVLTVNLGRDWAQEAREAALLGTHERCGAASPLRPLEPGVVRLILEFLR